jgi:hypothetical protein
VLAILATTFSQQSSYNRCGYASLHDARTRHLVLREFREVLREIDQRGATKTISKQGFWANHEAGQSSELSLCIKGCSNPSLQSIGRRRVIWLGMARIKTGALVRTRRSTLQLRSGLMWSDQCTLFAFAPKLTKANVAGNGRSPFTASQFRRCRAIHRRERVSCSALGVAWRSAVCPSWPAGAAGSSGSRCVHRRELGAKGFLHSNVLVKPQNAKDVGGVVENSSRRILEKIFRPE